MQGWRIVARRVKTPRGEVDLIARRGRSVLFLEGKWRATKIERDLWLTRPWFQPDYAGRPWTLWTANPRYRNEASDAPVRWVVLQQ